MLLPILKKFPIPADERVERHEKNLMLNAVSMGRIEWEALISYPVGTRRS
jgi:hypothetical protein